MTQRKIKVTLSEGSSVLKNWEQTCGTDLHSLTEGVKTVKQSVNEYLTTLVDQGKGPALKDESEHSTGEEEEEQDDVISGFIKNIGTGNANSKRSKKQKNNYSKKAKKLKK